MTKDYTKKRNCVRTVSLLEIRIMILMWRICRKGFNGKVGSAKLHVNKLDVARMGLVH